MTNRMFQHNTITPHPCTTQQPTPTPQHTPISNTQLIQAKLPPRIDMKNQIHIISHHLALEGRDKENENSTASVSFQQRPQFNTEKDISNDENPYLYFLI
jgi:hypothetical protein